MKVGLAATVVGLGLILFGWNPVGIILGIISAALLLFVDKETAAKQLENVPLPSFLLQKAMTNESLEKCRGELEENLRKQVCDAIEQTKATLHKACQAAVKDSLREISELSNTKKLSG